MEFVFINAESENREGFRIINESGIHSINFGQGSLFYHRTSDGQHCEYVFDDEGDTSVLISSGKTTFFVDDFDYHALQMMFPDFCIKIEEIEQNSEENISD